MTDDLVKRLRNNCSCNFESTPCGAEEECRNAFEAADHIEKLEAALREVANINNRRDRFSAEIDWVVFKALGKDDANQTSI